MQEGRLCALTRDAPAPIELPMPSREPGRRRREFAAEDAGRRRFFTEDPFGNRLEFLEDQRP